MPLVIVGGGRWGRTWLSVVVAARGSAKDVTLAARSSSDEVRAWAKTRAELAGLTVVQSLTEAMTLERPPQVAIISSRPRDHVPDGMQALDHGLHILVEKPLGVNSEGRRQLVTAARQRVLMVGTEFAYLPAFHQMAEELARSENIDLSLTWHDTRGEERYGATKVRHEETGLLEDLLPHAFSIFRVFIPRGALRIRAARESTDGYRGHIELDDDRGGHHEFRCDTNATARRRLLDIRTDSTHASVDFGGIHSMIAVNGQPHTLDQRMSAMISTLRLELGAFLSRATSATSATFTPWDALDLLSLQEELEEVRASKGVSSGPLQ